MRKDSSEQAPKSRHVWSEWSGRTRSITRRRLHRGGSSRRRPRPKRGRPQTTGRSILEVAVGTLRVKLRTVPRPHGIGGMSRRKPLQSRRQGWAVCRELIPELKFGTRSEISFQPFVTNTRESSDIAIKRLSPRHQLSNLCQSPVSLAAKQGRAQRRRHPQAAPPIPSGSYPARISGMLDPSGTELSWKSPQ